MRLKYLICSAMGGLFTLAGSGCAAAGPAGSDCAVGDRCNPGYVYSKSPVQTAPMGVHYGQPYDHLRRSEFVQTPQINVTRIETRAAMAELSDAPSHYWKGCGASGQAICARPAPRPVYRPAPPPPPAVDCSVPTRVVCIQNAPQPIAAPVFRPLPAPAPHPVYTAPVSGSTAISGSSVVAVNSDGTSWTQASGPTSVDGLYASSVLCKQPAPAPAPVTTVVQQHRFQVVRPVVNVHYPVPAPGCAPPPRNIAPAPYGATQNSGGYGGNVWTY
ncbi:hypothetical protein [Robiginitomaculum antarcticum]|uniref:hypothetical protein n=1 Tax=Robiginitomaculum antarcticum TaxID=437507 RepID=UPI00037C35CB|nr:hypothetical protein [Robiginitomaculum antarcticum]